MYIKIQSGILTFSIITLNKAQCRYLGEIMAEMITLYSQQRSVEEGEGGLVVHNNSDEDDEQLSWQANIDAGSRGRKS